MTSLTKRLTALLLTLCLAFSLTAVLAEDWPEADTTADLDKIDKYGDIVLNITSGELAAAGFEYADVVNVGFAHKVVTVPVIPEYRYVEAKGAALVMWRDPERPAELEIFNGSFAATHELAEKTTNEDKTFFWTANEKVAFPLKVSIMLAIKGGYAEDYLLFDLQRSNERADYPDLSDAEFANFRAVSTTGMGEGKLYRASSPVNPSIGRNTYADAAAKEAGVKAFINLADSAESAAAYAGYADSYYASQNILFLNLGVDFSTDANKAGLAEAIRFIGTNEGPYLVHCNEGQDRAGFVSAVLECLMGANYAEVEADYMTTFANYYGVQEGTEQYTAIANNINKNLRTAFGVKDVTRVDLKTSAVVYLKSLGLSDEEIAAAQANLGE